MVRGLFCFFLVMYCPSLGSSAGLLQVEGRPADGGQQEQLKQVAAVQRCVQESGQRGGKGGGLSALVGAAYESESPKPDAEKNRLFRLRAKIHVLQVSTLRVIFCNTAGVGTCPLPQGKCRIQHRSSVLGPPKRSQNLRVRNCTKWSQSRL